MQNTIHIEDPNTLRLTTMFTKTSSGRIKIRKQRRQCLSSRLSVFRAMPAVLGGHMGDGEWNAFCDELDEALKPLNRVKTIQSVMTVLFFLCLICGILFSVADFDSKFKGYYFFWALAGVSIVSAIVIPSLFGNNNTDELVNVCDVQSERNPTLIFHVRNEDELFGDSHSRTYIEVQVSKNAQTPTAPVESLWAEPEAVVSATPVKDISSHGRLEELERLKPYLTDAEYQQKRQEIVVSV